MHLLVERWLVIFVAVTAVADRWTHHVYYQCSFHDGVSSCYGFAAVDRLHVALIPPRPPFIRLQTYWQLLEGESSHSVPKSIFRASGLSVDFHIGKPILAESAVLLRCLRV